MAASVSHLSTREWRMRRRWWLMAVAPVPLVVIATSWWLTEPLADRGAPGSSASAGSAPVAVPAEVKALAAGSKRSLDWPRSRLEGRRAKELLLDILFGSAERLNRVEAYTATFRKQERINGKLGPVQTMAMKVRQKPFAVYFKFLNPQEGKEVVYAEGHHDNKLIAHSGGVARFLVPRLAVPPDHPVALADARHPITEAGLANLTSRLIHFRRADLDDPQAETVLDRTTDPQGRERLRSVHTHPEPQGDRLFARVEVLYDPETFYPVDIRNYDWPMPGGSGTPELAEHYSYDELDLDASLTTLDFDPSNPSYAFHRY